MPFKRHLTNFSFPGVRPDVPSARIKHLPRERAGGDAEGLGFVEYVLLACDELLDATATTAAATTYQRPTVFVSHGRLRALDDHSVEQWASATPQAGVNIVLRNYPGYGNTVRGENIVNQIVEDGNTLMRACCPDGDEAVGVLGNSIGCGPAMYMAARGSKLVKRIVLVSPYVSLWALVPNFCLTPLTNVLGRISPKAQDWLCSFLGDPSRLQLMQMLPNSDPFPMVKMAKELRPGTEVMVVHGDMDGVIPFNHSNEMMDALNETPGVTAIHCVVPGARHRHTRMLADIPIWTFLRGDGMHNVILAIEAMQSKQKAEKVEREGLSNGD